MEHATRVGGRIKAQRRAKGLSAAALAAQAGVTENAIRKIESGDSKEPRFSTGLRIAVALGVDPNELVGASAAAERSAIPVLGVAVRRIRECRTELAQRGVLHASVFGSVASGNATSTSDVDVVIEPSSKRPFTLFDLVASKEILEKALRMRVDVVTAATLQRSNAGRRAAREAVRAF